MTEAMLVRSAQVADADAIADIYNHYITETVVTFEVDAVSAAELAGRMERVQSKSFPWLVAQRDDEIVGYAYANQWQARYAYRFTAETAVYLAPGHIGQGIGSGLYNELIELLTASGIHALIGGIALPNEPSVALHEKFGFTRAALYREVGFKFDRWIDVGYWQRFLGPTIALKEKAKKWTAKR